ncbi:DNA-binding transcriptional regulator, PadR family [Asanoa hainanensis]|uniref:DNA-binding transcriptional regulator, PadR family n=1 Tax=Asanoa hainanensis TaxID=560556 RepID=A0A239LT78_9ACTN|nr:PadR family transcriptional regulator [Asanoa hainanensis]SNT33013.1 DNA-binding transcriptional regulator, PadR family [Asanoa hainanensis]
MPPRKITNLLALAILATLIERPMHPYEMASLMKARGKEHDMEIKWGSLYRVVENLVKHGFVEAVQSERQGGRPERTVYRITDAGRTELVDWTRELVAVPARRPGPFTAGLSVLAVLAPSDVAALLGRRADLLAAEIALFERELAGYDVPRLFLVEGEYELAMRRAELAWVRGFRAEITEGTLPGVADWRAYHETGELPPAVAELVARGKEE